MAGVLPTGGSCCSPGGACVSTPLSVEGLIDAAIQEALPEFNPLDYGAIGDGATDDRNAIQAALNAASEVYGVVIFTPRRDGNPGHYRLVATMPVYGGNASMRGLGGKIWVSLPTGYVNPNTPVTEPYTATHVLNSAGAYVTWTYPGALNYPWNGKTEVFTGFRNARWDNIDIDFGWGTTNAPVGVIPITGIRNDSDEMTYYQGINDSQFTTFSNCRMSNAPGAYIEVGHDVVVDGSCRFTEYGDHVLYMGQDADGSGTQKNYSFIGNIINCSRAPVSVLGNAAFVYSSFRDAIKLRGNSNTVIADNTFNDTNDLITGIHLEINDGQPGDIEFVQIANNNIRASVGIDCFGFRNNGGFGANDYRIRNVLIDANVIKMTNSGIRFRAACDGLSITNNRFTGTGTVASLIGHPKWVDPIKGLWFAGNQCASNAAIHIYLAGNVADATIKNNRFVNTGVPCSSNSSVIYPGNPFDIDVTTTLALSTRFTELTIEDNKCYNFYSWMGDSGYPAYDNTATYPFVTANGIQVYSVVSFGGSLWYNTATTTGGGNPNVNVNWAGFVRGSTAFAPVLRKNYRYCNSATATPLNSAYLCYLSAPSALLHMDYFCLHEGNINRNSLGEAIGFSFATITDNEMVASSRYNTLATGILISGKNTGQIKNFDEFIPVNDFKFRAAGACDEYRFYDGEAGPKHIQVGINGSGFFDVAVFSGVHTKLRMTSEGKLQFGDETDDPTSPVILRGTGTPEAVVTAPPGSHFLRTDGGAGTAFYVKESGTGNVGWIAK